MTIYVGMRPNRSLCNAVMNPLSRELGARQALRTRPLPEDCRAYVQWGAKDSLTLRHANERGLPCVILDHGYFGDRLECVSLSFNGLHGWSRWLYDLPGLAGPHPELQEWQEVTDEQAVYVYGQMPGDQALAGLEIGPWLVRTAQEASDAFGRPAVVRPHPKTLNWREQRAQPSLASTFPDTYVAVSYTSTAAVQAVIAGIPVVADWGSPAAHVAAHKWERLTPERGEWIHQLSHRNFRLDELPAIARRIQSGIREVVES